MHIHTLNISHKSSKYAIAFDFKHQKLGELKDFAKHMDEILFDSNQNEKIGINIMVSEEQEQGFELLSGLYEITRHNNQLINGEDMLEIAQNYENEMILKINKPNMIYELFFFYYPIDIAEQNGKAIIKENTHYFNSLQNKDFHYDHLFRSPKKTEKLKNLAILAEKRELEKRMIHPTYDKNKTILKM